MRATATQVPARCSCEPTCAESGSLTARASESAPAAASSTKATAPTPSARAGRDSRVQRTSAAPASDPGGQPSRDEQRERLGIVARELLERQRARDVGPGAEPAEIAQQVQPARARHDGQGDGQPRGHAGQWRRAMTLRLPSVAGLAWLVAGLLGAWTYVDHYYVYRGFPPPGDPPGVAHGRLESVRFFSPALGQERQYSIYLPPGYAAAAARGTRFPVLYLLHGSPGNTALFVNAGRVGVDLDTLIARHRIHPFLIAMPNGSDGSFRSDTEWANTSHGRYESFVTDVVRNVDRSFSTVRDRRARALAGDSEGAFAAMNVALHRLPVFATAEVWSGYFTQDRHGPFKRASARELWANSPAAYVPTMRARLRRFPLHAFLYTGAGDHDRGTLEPFVAELRAAGAHPSFGVYPGGHEWRLWRAQMPRMMVYASAHMRRPLP